MKAIKLSIAGRSPIEINQDSVTLGTAADCGIKLSGQPDVKPNHAILRMIDDRWVIEVRDADSIFVGGTVSKKAHWLNPGDQFSLVPNGPIITFDMVTKKPVESAKKSSGSIAKAPRPQESDVDFAPESDAELAAVQTSSSAKIRKPLSSAIISQKPKATSSRDDFDDLPLTIADPNKPSSKSSVPKSGPSTVVISPKSATETAVHSKSSTHEMPTVDKGRKSSDTATIPVTKPASKSKIKVPLDDLDDAVNSSPAAKVPVLKRLSSYDAPVQSLENIDLDASFDESPSRRRSKKDEEEIRWIKQVVIRSLIAGGIALVALIAIRELWRVMTTPSVSPVSTTSVRLIESVEQHADQVS